MTSALSEIHEVFENEGLLFSILSYVADEDGRNTSCLFVCRSMTSLLTSDAAFQWRSQRLELEYGIFMGAPKTDMNYREAFLEAYRRKRLFAVRRDPSFDRASASSFSMRVCARFKPRVESESTSHGKMGNVILPLHQRLALIRLCENLPSNQHALKVLNQHGGLFRGKQDTGTSAASSTTDSEDTPAEDQKHTNAGLSGGLHSVDSDRNRILWVHPSKGLRAVPFDCVFDDAAHQDHVYRQSTQSLVTDFMRGISVTCLVYGQTGAGKTYTMMGGGVDSPVPHSSWGILPRACWDVFAALEKRTQTYNESTLLVQSIESNLSMSYVEIFGNQVSDLLRQGQPCGQSTVAAQRYVLDGGAEQVVSSFEELWSKLQEGEQYKRVAATRMNARSSRAHSMLILSLRQHCFATGRSVKSKLFLVDLGGSEQLKKSQPTEEQADDVVTRKARTTEAVHINMGLMALKQCIQALWKRKKRQKAQITTPVYIPFSSSKLTMLLSTGLGGRSSKASIVICGSQQEDHAYETMLALRFGQECRKIQGNANERSFKVDLDCEPLLVEVIQDLNNRIADCQRQIEQHERWETTMHQRPDGHGGTETFTTSRLVGAESFHAEMEVLLQKRGQLTGLPY